MTNDYFLLPINKLMPQETKEKTIEPIKASQKLLILNPLKYPTKEKQIALIINKNNPNVRMVMGKVKIFKMGLTTALTNPKIIAPIAAVVQLLISIPGTILAVIIKDTAVTIQVIKKRGIDDFS